MPADSQKQEFPPQVSGVFPVAPEKFPVGWPGLRERSELVRAGQLQVGSQTRPGRGTDEVRQCLVDLKDQEAFKRKLQSMG